MKKGEWQVPNLPEYRHIQIDWEEWRRKYAEFKKRKKPTSIALAPETIAELKAEAMKQRLPYQVLMRNFILEGLDKCRVADRNQTPPYLVRPRKKREVSIGHVTIKKKDAKARGHDR